MPWKQGIRWWLNLTHALVISVRHDRMDVTWLKQSSDLYRQIKRSEGLDIQGLSFTHMYLVLRDQSSYCYLDTYFGKPSLFDIWQTLQRSWEPLSDLRSLSDWLDWCSTIWSTLQVSYRPKSIEGPLGIGTVADRLEARSALREVLPFADPTHRYQLAVRNIRRHHNLTISNRTFSFVSTL